MYERSHVGNYSICNNVIPTTKLQIHVNVYAIWLRYEEKYESSTKAKHLTELMGEPNVITERGIQLLISYSLILLIFQVLLFILK